MRINRKRLLTIAVSMFLAVTSVFQMHTMESYASTPMTFNPIADSYVRDGSYASNNYGNASTMITKNGQGSGFNRKGFVKFDLSSLGGVHSAQLRLYGNTDISGTLTVNSVSDSSWTESGITWNNAPVMGASIGNASMNTTAQYRTIDITEYIQSQFSGGNKIISMGLLTNAAYGTFHTKESTYKPELVIEPSFPMVAPPTGYNEVFKSDFSNTTLTATSSGSPSQWWYDLGGGEYGYDWEDTATFTGGAPIRIQTLVGGGKTLSHYVYSSIFNEGGVQGKVLRSVNIQNDSDYTAGTSRNQLLSTSVTNYNKSFHEFKFKVPSSLANALKAIGGNWLDFTEFWKIGSKPVRLSVYLNYNAVQNKYYFRVQSRNDGTGVNIWQTDVDANISWDTWHTLSMQVETVGNGPTDGLVKLWLNGDLIVNQIGEIGYPIYNINYLKLYTSSASMSHDTVEMLFDDLIIYKKNE